MHADRWMTVGVIVALAILGCRDDEETNGKDSDGSPSQTDGGGGGDVTIYQIMKGEISESASVTLKDVIVTAVDGHGEYTGDIFVQEADGGPYSGIKVYQPQRVDGGEVSDLKLGDHLRIEGVVKYFTQEFNDSQHPDRVHIKELDKGAQVERISEGPPLAPVEVTPADLLTGGTAEGWEHVLVTVKDVAVTKTVHPDYGEFEVTWDLPVTDDLHLHTPAHADCLTITGIAGYWYGYKLMVRSGEDVQAGSGCEVPTEVTIAELQDETAGGHPAVDSWVKVTGVVSAVDGSPSGSSEKYYGFWIQEEGESTPYSGMYVYYSWKDSLSGEVKPKLGEEVEIYGLYVEHKSSSSQTDGTLTQLKEVSWLNLGQSGNPPTPKVIAAADVATGGDLAEEYEGTLVRVENVKVADYVLSSESGTKVGIILEGERQLQVEKELYDFMDPTLPEIGAEFSAIIGALQYSFDEFKLLPTSADDIVPK